MEVTPVVWFRNGDGFDVLKRMQAQRTLLRRPGLKRVEMILVAVGELQLFVYPFSWQMRQSVTR